MSNIDKEINFSMVQLLLLFVLKLFNTLINFFLILSFYHSYY